MVKHHKTYKPTSEEKMAQKYAVKLVSLYSNHQNKAASAIGMSRGRMSFIVHGKFDQVSVNRIDVIMLVTGCTVKEKDAALTQEARDLLGEFQSQLSRLNTTASNILRVLRRL